MQNIQKAYHSSLCIEPIHIEAIMSLITDPLYLIHISRIKFLRMDERGERIITFSPTVMSDEYVRLAAPVYPEMQYCYSPVYDSYLNSDTSYNSNKLTSSPRTTKRNYRQHKPQQTSLNKFSNIRYPTKNMVNNQLENKPSTTSDSEDDDIDIDKLSNPGQSVVMEEGNGSNTTPATITAANNTANISTTSLHDSATPTAAGPSTLAAVSRSFQTTSLHPSVDSAIDPSPTQSSMGDTGNASNHFPPTFGTDSTMEEVKATPLEYTKKAPVQKRKNTSALSALIAEKATAAENPFAEYSFVSGKGESKSITLCVYLPHSNEPYTPVSLVVRPDAITDDVIGYILYDYVEEKRQPELDVEAYDLAEWVLLIAEDDGEIEDDLPAVDRTRNIGRVSFDQFALCRATPSQAKQNDIDRARMGRTKPDIETLRKKKEAATVNAGDILNTSNELTLPSSATQEVPLSSTTTAANAATATNSNSIPKNNGGGGGGGNEVLDNSPNVPEDEISQTFNAHLLSTQQQNQPDASTVAVPVPSSKATLTKATMPMTPSKFFRIKLMTNEEVSATTTMPVHAEMFIGDVLELISRKRKLDPNEYMLTIGDSNVIVPADTTVESMKGITNLTFQKKTPTLSIPSSSASHLWRSPIKRKKDESNQPMYFSTTESPSGLSTSNVNDGLLSQYKKYTVSRKMPMFVSKRVYILAIDGDYIHLMPPEHKGMFDSVKTTSFHASAVRACKQSKKVPTNFKIMISKEININKTYDLEAETQKEASEICSRIRFLMQVTKGA